MFNTAPGLRPRDFNYLLAPKWAKSQTFNIHNIMAPHGFLSGNAGSVKIGLGCLFEIG